jgi:hypothetical protein
MTPGNPGELKPLRIDRSSRESSKCCRFFGCVCALVLGRENAASARHPMARARRGRR